MADESGFSSWCLCWLPALGLAVSQQQTVPCVSAAAAQRCQKRPSHHDTASATPSLVPARARAAHGKSWGCIQPSRAVLSQGLPAQSVPLSHPSGLSFSLFASFSLFVHSGDYPRMTTSLSSPVQGLTWQPCVPPMSRGVWVHRAGKDGGWQGQGSVELPPPLPRAMCWLRHSHAGSLQPL